MKFLQESDVTLAPHGKQPQNFLNESSLHPSFPSLSSLEDSEKNRLLSNSFDRDTRAQRGRFNYF